MQQPNFHEEKYLIQGTLRYQDNVKKAFENYGKFCLTTIVNTKRADGSDYPALVCQGNKSIILGHPRFPKNFDQEVYTIFIEPTVFGFKIAFVFEIFLEYVKKDGLALKNCHNQETWPNREEICLAAVKQNGLALEFVKNQSTLKNREEIVMEAVKNNPDSLKFVVNQTILKNREEIVMEAVKKRGCSLKYITNQSMLKNREEIMFEAVKQDIRAFVFIKNQSSLKNRVEIISYVVKLKGSYLSLVENPETLNIWPELCLTVAKQQGFVLHDEYKNLPNYPELCLAIVKSNGLNLKQCKIQTEEICIAAVKSNQKAIEFVENKTEEICKLCLGCKYAEKFIPENIVRKLKNIEEKEGENKLDELTLDYNNLELFLQMIQTLLGEQYPFIFDEVCEGCYLISFPTKRAQFSLISGETWKNVKRKIDIKLKGNKPVECPICCDKNTFEKRAFSCPKCVGYVCYVCCNGIIKNQGKFICPHCRFDVSTLYNV